jgi:hypothetical protein
MASQGHLIVAGMGTVTYRSMFSPCFCPLPPTHPMQRGTYTITGGNGMFKGATGRGAYIERFSQGRHAPTGPVTVTFEGTLKR